MTAGPFEVTSTQVVSLGPRFGAFVNRLLALELKAHGIPAHQLSTTDNETTGDGGVDAVVRGASATDDWIPAGDSGWQYKRADVGPAKCAEEFAGAKSAHEILKSGGSYLLVVGADLPDNLITRRRDKIVKKALELKLLKSDDPSRIRVYNATKLATWASNYPALAVSNLLGGPGRIAIDHAAWSAIGPHHLEWVPDQARLDAIASIQDAVEASGPVGLRVYGEQGIGKTRLVLEALRDESLAPFVAYFADDSIVSAQLIAHLVDEGRTAILVVDECVPERHRSLLERLPPRDSTIKLITVGPTGQTFTSNPRIEVELLGEEQVLTFLRTNFPQVVEEHRRLIASHCAGNPRWARLLAEQVIETGSSNFTELLARGDIEHFLSTVLPEGDALFLAAVLALCERVGWDRELKSELELLANFAGVETVELEQVGKELERGGLLMRQGRYRSVGPHPVAVFLAAHAWEMAAHRIVTELLPKLDAMAPAFFRRVADLGRFEPARRVLPALLAEEGPYGTLSSIEERGADTSLAELAVVLPREVSRHLATLIHGADLDVLHANTASRRDLVWTLEKLAWNSATFREAADSLLRLALAENETFANNAGGTWIDLFGTMLPGTAANPEERAAYLAAVANRDDPLARMFAVRACERILTRIDHESISVSGEIQGGVLVEPRGRPETWGEVRAYRRSGIATLDKLRHDSDATVAEAATKVAIGAIHPLIDEPVVGEALADLVVTFVGEDLARLRREIEHLIKLRERIDASDLASDAALIDALLSLRDRLPEPTALEHLRLALEFSAWDFQDQQLTVLIRERLSAVTPSDRVALLEELRGADVPAAAEFGRGLAYVEGQNTSVEYSLAANFQASPSMLVGYLAGLVDNGSPEAFDEFLTSEIALTALDRSQILEITARGPATDSARERVETLSRDLPVQRAVRALFAWRRQLSEDEFVRLAAGWLQRLDDQGDYDALVDWLAYNVFDREDVSPAFKDVAFATLQARRQFPEVGRQNWDWAQLAKHVTAEHPHELAALLLELLDAGHLMLFQHEYESEILKRCAEVDPNFVWAELSRRLEAGSWRVEMETRGWLIDTIPIAVIASWVGDSIERARLVASVATSRANAPTESASYLLIAFAGDEEIRGALASALLTGTWVGPESLRLEGMIEELSGWEAVDAYAPPVKAWAEWLIEGLKISREHALEREAERDW